MSLSVTPPFTLTEEECSLLPSDSDVEFYAEHGWYLSKKLFTDGEVDELVAASERYYAGERDRALPLRPPRLARSSSRSATASQPGARQAPGTVRHYRN